MKAIVKRVVRLVALALVSPVLVSYWVRRSVVGADRALAGSSQALSLVPGLPGVYLRAAFYARALEQCHESACIEFGTLFSKAGARVGENAYIGPRCHIGLADIGRDVLLAAGVHVPSGARIHGTSELDVPIREQQGELSRVRVGEGAWVASGAVVMADVGPGCIVGAGAVVTKPVPALAIVGGVPARVIRYRADGAAGAAHVGSGTGAG